MRRGARRKGRYGQGAVAEGGEEQGASREEAGDDQDEECSDQDEDEENAGLEVEEEEESDSEEEDFDSEEDSEEIEEGCFVWAPFGRRLYPAQVVSLAAIPQDLHRQLMTKRTGHTLLKWIGEVGSTGQEVDTQVQFCGHRETEASG